MSREIEQILKNQVVIMGMLQDLQDELEPIQNIEDTHQLLVDKTNGWIPCTERLPDNDDDRFYICLVENHIEDEPICCQFDDGEFGYRKDYYDAHSLGFLDSEFKTMDELGMEKVVYWRELPKPPKEPYREEQEDEQESDNNVSN